MAAGQPPSESLGPTTKQWHCSHAAGISAYSILHIPVGVWDVHYGACPSVSLLHASHQTGWQTRGEGGEQGIVLIRPAHTLRKAWL